MDNDDTIYYVKITPGTGCEHFQSRLLDMVDFGSVEGGRVTEFYPDRFNRKLPGYVVVRFEPSSHNTYLEDDGTAHEADNIPIDRFLEQLKLNTFEGKVIELEDILRAA